MEFIPRNNLSHSHDAQVDSMIQLESELTRQQQDKPQTPFSVLNQTLSNLNNDSLKRYNRDVNMMVNQFSKFNSKSAKPHRHYRQINSTFDQVLVPQPWFNADSPLFPSQSTLTQIRQRNSNNFHSISKSFHLSKNVNNNNSQNHYSNHSSVSLNNDQQNRSLYGKREKWKQKLSTFLTEENQNNAQNFVTYSYSSEQKARMTLEHLVHRKRHSKMSKILKLKTQSFDNTLHKQQRLTNQSKHLIESLQKFSSDNMLRKSIDRAVDVLKKRTHTILYNKSKSKKQFRKSSINEYQTNWLSFHKIVVNSGQEEQQKSERTKREIKIDKFLINGDMKPNVVGQEKAIQTQIKSKIAFKPKRSHLIQRRDKISADKQIRVQKMGNYREGTNKRGKQPVKHNFGSRKHVQ